MPLYFSFLKTYAPALIGTLLLGAVLGLGFMSLQPKMFDVSLEVDITRIQKDSDKYYQYDGFYALRASNKFASVVKGWFQTPSFVTTVLEQSEKAETPETVAGLRNVFQSEKISASTVEVRWTVSSPKEGNQVSEVIRNTIQSKTNSEGRDKYTLSVSDPVIERHRYNPLFFGVAGAALGLGLGIIGTLIAELRNPRI